MTLLVLKLTVLLLSSLTLAHLLRHGPAVARHRFWSGVFAGMLVLPVLAASVPALDVPLPGRWTSGPVAAQLESQGAETTLVNDRVGEPASPRTRGSVATLGQPAVQSDRSTAPPSLSLTAALFVTWFAGAASAAVALALSLVRVRRLVRSAEEVCDSDWRRAAEEISARLGLQRPVRLLVSATVATPMAGGMLRPTIFLPACATSWTAEQRDIVLAHEIAHLVRRDPLRHLVARFALACYWFHPLAWVAARQAAVAREEACDETVLSLGTRPSAYAQVLLDLADTISPRAYALTALPMVQRSMLEKRVMTILSTDRRPTGRQRLLMTTFGFALFTVVISIARPVAFAPRPAQEQETILDPSLRTAGMSPVWAPDGREFWFETTLRIGGGQAGRAQEPSCALDTNHAGSFRGRITASHRGGVTEQVGRHGNDYVIEKTFGDLRACMLAEGVDDQGTADRPSQWIDRARYVVLATASAGRSQRLEVVRAPAGPERVTWTVAGVVRPPDRATEQWRSQLLAVLDTTWEVSSLRGHVSSLRGEISSIFGERSSLQGEISSLGGEVSSMRGEVSSVRGHESSLRGEISSILGHESSLRGAISSEHGAISSLNANRYAADSTERARIAKRIAEHDREIDRIEREIRDYNAAARVAAVEKEIAAYDADGKVAAIEARIKAFDLNRRIADVERRIGALEVEKRTAALDGQIEALDADRRARQLEERRTEEVKRLEGTIQGIR